MDLDKTNKVQHLAKYNKVWKHIKTGELKGVSLELSAGEKITDYMEVAKPKIENKVLEKTEEEKANNKMGFSNYNLNKK